jgi:hypothetical protein
LSGQLFLGQTRHHGPRGKLLAESGSSLKPETGSSSTARRISPRLPESQIDAATMVANGPVQWQCGLVEESQPCRGPTQLRPDEGATFRRFAPPMVQTPTGTRGGDVFRTPAYPMKTHVEHIDQKLGANDRTAAVAEAMRRRLIE